MILFRIATSAVALGLLAGCAHDTHDHDHHDQHGTRTSQKITVEPMTECLPERIVVAPGVTVIPDVTDRSSIPGVDTLEGRMGPLLLTPRTKAYFMEMVPGFFIHDHPHRSRMLIYTVAGRWVLCSEGGRTVMEPRSLFVFEPNRPTGYEVPFDEKAVILVFEECDSQQDPETFMEGLRGLKARLQRRHDDGMPFFLSELDPDHPARVFARKVNPQFAHKLDQAGE